VSAVIYPLSVRIDPIPGSHQFSRWVLGRDLGCTRNPFRAYYGQMRLSSGVDIEIRSVYDMQFGHHLAKVGLALVGVPCLVVI
jgi:hypothetical protein